MQLLIVMTLLLNLQAPNAAALSQDKKKRGSSNTLFMYGRKNSVCSTDKIKQHRLWLHIPCKPKPQWINGLSISFEPAWSNQAWLWKSMKLLYCKLQFHSKPHPRRYPGIDLHFKCFDLHLSIETRVPRGCTAYLQCTLRTKCARTQLACLSMHIGSLSTNIKQNVPFVGLVKIPLLILLKSVCHIWSRVKKIGSQQKVAFIWPRM